MLYGGVMKILFSMLIIVAVTTLTPADAGTIFLCLLEISPIVAPGAIGLYAVMILLSMAPRKPVWVYFALTVILVLSTCLTIGHVNKKNDQNAMGRLFSDPLVRQYQKEIRADSTRRADLELKVDDLKDDYWRSLDGKVRVWNNAVSSREEKEARLSEIDCLNANIRTNRDSLTTRKKLLQSRGSELDQGLASGVVFLSAISPVAGNAFSFTIICLSGFVISMSSVIAWGFVPYVFPKIKNLSIYRRECFQIKAKGKNNRQLPKKTTAEIKAKIQSVGNVENVGNAGNLSNIKTTLPEKCRNVPIIRSKVSKKSRKVSIITRMVLDEYDGNIDAIPVDVELCRIVRDRFGINIGRSTMNEYINNDVKPLLLAEGVSYENE
ncbi:MAG: hypothetical protein GY820_38640 [Gammaproteobacteria bacterium]|nr:hypothetical protein [Gammaproteobacteria bacterium]